MRFGAFALWLLMTGLLEGQTTTPRLCASAENCRPLCAAGDGAACARLGYLYGQGLGVAQSNETAALFSEQGCRLGAAFGCANLGSLLVDGDGVPRDVKRGGELLELACDKGRTFACRKLAELALKGRLAKNAPKEPARYERACRGGDSDACIRLGWTYEAGLIAKEGPQLVRADGLYDRACALGDARGCELKKTMVGRVLDRSGDFPTCNMSTKAPSFTGRVSALKPEDLCLETGLETEPHEE